MRPGERPTGIIRTLPYYGSHCTGEELKARMKLAYDRMIRSFNLLETGSRSITQVYIALDKKPAQEVLNLYLLIEGKIIVRGNIAGYAAGNSLDIKCWDDTVRRPNWWAVVTGPVSWPESPVKMRGFQGFRYTSDLW